jgi:virulence-associated protein VagC
MSESENEKIIGLVKVFRSGVSQSLVITIPKEVVRRLNFSSGERLLVKTDGKRLIYERIEPVREEGRLKQ